MANKSLFIVFGVGPDKDTLIENHVNDFESVVLVLDAMSCHGYTARVWDTLRKKFVTPMALLYAEIWYSHSS